MTQYPLLLKTKMNRCRSCDGLFKPSIPTQTSQHSALQKTSKWHGTLLSFSVFVPGVALDSSNTLKRPTSRRSTSIFGGHQSVRRQVRVFVENTWLRVLVHVTLRRRSGGMRDGCIHGGLPAIPRLLLLLLLLRWQQRKKGKLPHVRGGAVRTIVAVSSSPGSTDLTLSRTSSSRAQQIETLRVVLSVGARTGERTGSGGRVAESGQDSSHCCTQSTSPSHWLNDSLGWHITQELSRISSRQREIRRVSQSKKRDYRTESSPFHRGCLFQGKPIHRLNSQTFL